MASEEKCPYVVYYWKYTDETKKSYTCATPEDAQWAEVKLSKIQYTVEKFQLPADTVRLYRFLQYLEEAYRSGISRGLQQVRQALGL